MNKQHWLLAPILAWGAALVPFGLLETGVSKGTQANDSDMLVLKGLKGVTVNVVQPVSGFEDRPKFNPVSVDDLHASVKRILNEAGIEVFQNASDDPEIGHVMVTVNAWKDKIHTKLIVQIKTELYQLAELIRDTGLQIMVPTWPLGEWGLETETPLIVTHSELARTVQNEVLWQTKLLVRHYREANPTLEPKHSRMSMMTGTVRYVPIEGGFFGIVADNGKCYDPVNLPREYAKDALRIAFQAVACEDRVSIHMWGTIVRITRITKL